MAKGRRVAIVFIVFFSLWKASEAQDSSNHEQRVRDMVNFLEYLINTVGSQETTTRDKDVIINQSYNKVFRDAEVQIEDDLVEDRKTLINKDVVAYLKDVDFFFQDASFDFDIINIESLKRDNGDPYYRIELNRTLKAINIKGEKISNSQKRYIEINLDPSQDDLKIASIYTTKISRDKELKSWWAELSYEWNKIFMVVLNTNQNPGIDDLNKVLSLDSLDISGNRYIMDIQPLYMLSNLSYLNISETRIADLGPLRSNNTLNSLIANNTEIYSLEYLKYMDNLKELDISNTRIREIGSLEPLSSLQRLDLSNNYISDFTPLSSLTDLQVLDLSNSALTTTTVLSSLVNLKELDLSNTLIQEINGLKGMSELVELNLTQTDVNNLRVLVESNKLQVLNINYTNVSSLEPIKSEAIRKIYCDNAGINESQAQKFMASHPGVLVINNSQKVAEWWGQLNSSWKDALSRFIPDFTNSPSKEQLVLLLNIDSLNLKDARLTEVTPIQPFNNLRYLNLHNNQITNIAPLSELGKLEVLIGSEMPTEDITPLKGLKGLRYVDISGTFVSDIYALSFNDNLKFLNVDDARVGWEAIREFKEELPSCEVVFDTKYLTNWWANLDPTWKDIFRRNIELSSAPSTIELHRLVALKEVEIQKSNIQDLKPLWDFISITKLSIKGSSVNDLSTIPGLTDLTELIMNQSPVVDIAPIGELDNLKILDISNTAVEDLRPLATLNKLEVINCSGTNLSNLKGLENLKSLQSIDCSNTRVNRLDQLYELERLNELTCFNTRLNQRDINSFRDVQPECEIVFY